MSKSCLCHPFVSMIAPFSIGFKCLIRFRNIIGAWNWRFLTLSLSQSLTSYFIWIQTSSISAPNSSLPAFCFILCVFFFIFHNFYLLYSTIQTSSTSCQCEFYGPFGLICCLKIKYPSNILCFCSIRCSDDDIIVRLRYWCWNCNNAVINGSSQWAWVKEEKITYFRQGKNKSQIKYIKSEYYELKIYSIQFICIFEYNDKCVLQKFG